MINESTMIQVLKAKAIKENCDYFNTIVNEAKRDHNYYQYFNIYLKYLNDSFSYTRYRSFIMLITIAKWDKLNQIDMYLTTILKYFDNEKPIFVRLGIQALPNLIKNKLALLNIIIEKIKSLDINKYPPSMGPLIKKDINNLLLKYSKKEKI